MSVFNVKDFTTGLAVKIKSLVVNTDENIPTHAILDSTGAEVIGTKADAAWDGAASSASGISIWKYIGSKVEAVRAVLAGVIASGRVSVSLDPTQIGTPGQRPVAEATTVIPPSDASFPVVDGGSGLSSLWGVGGVPVASADMSAGTFVTDAPTSTKKIVIDDVLFSVGATAMSITLKEETSGAVVFGPWYCPANSGPIQITLRGKKKLAVADKRVQAFTSAAGNITVQLGYHSEA